MAEKTEPEDRAWLRGRTRLPAAQRGRSNNVTYDQQIDGNYQMYGGRGAAPPPPNTWFLGTREWDERAHAVVLWAGWSWWKRGYSRSGVSARRFSYSNAPLAVEEKYLESFSVRGIFYTNYTPRVYHARGTYCWVLAKFNRRMHFHSDPQGHTDRIEE